MDALEATGGAAASQAGQTVDLALLKKAQDFAKEQSAAILAALPPPVSPSPPGVGTRVDITA